MPEYTEATAQVPNILWEYRVTSNLFTFLRIHKNICFWPFILATIPAYHGYYMKGGALEVGKAATTSFVWTSVVIILVNYVITQLLLG